MARDEKPVELKPVDDVPELKIDVPRLESDETRQRQKLVRLSPKAGDADTSHRLELPSREVIETRTYQPGIEALIETESTIEEQSEDRWGQEAGEQRHIPWGWFALIALILSGALIWSLTRVKDSEQHAQIVRKDSAKAIKNETEEETEAQKLVERIETNTRRYFAASTVEELLPLVRDAERVRPMMENYYTKRAALTPHKVAATSRIQPLTIDRLGDFWVISVKLDNASPQNLIMDVSDVLTPKIDWETQVCYQPMDWDAFAKERPTNHSYDFRVYVEIDTFHSHEFSDSSKWNCFRLTATGADAALFGYAKVNDQVSRELLELITRNRYKKTSVILRLSIPEGLQSRGGVVLEKLMSPRWLYVAYPDSGS